MLDECKGDKFHEILALFSNAVLKKVLTAQSENERDAAIARKLATAPTMSVKSQKSLLPLAIAHKAALMNVLKRKDEKRRQFLRFEALLNAKLGQVNQRLRKCKDTPRAKRPAVSQKEAEAVKKQLKANWIGNQKWLDIMLYGDNVQPEDAFLNNHFDKVWRTVKMGLNLEDAVPEAGLLENLQSRVQEQQTRLQKWKQFHNELQKDNLESSSTTAKAPPAAKEFKFDNHLQYQLPPSKQTSDKPVQRPALRPEYHDVLFDMDYELSRVITAKPNRPTVPRLTRATSSSSSLQQHAQSGVNVRSNSIPKTTAGTVARTKPIPPPKKRPEAYLSSALSSRPVVPVTKPKDLEATLIDRSSIQTTAPVPHSPEPLTNEQKLPVSESRDGELLSPTSSPPPAINNSPLPIQDSPSPSQNLSSTYSYESPTPIFEPPSLDPEEALAEQIINAIGAATPSPVKKPQPRMSMSLMERTRMTLSRTPSLDPHSNPIPESPDLPLPTIVAPESSIDPESDAPHPTTLLERTRLTMATRPRASLGPSNTATSQKDKASRKSKSRNSLFPVNQFDTPRTRRSFELLEQDKTAEKTPKDMLLSDQVDYDRVFKSRPRVATSPIRSPVEDDVKAYDDEDESEEEVTGIDLADVDRDEDEDEGGEGFTMAWKDSPSRRAASGRRAY